jgi:hypothetical protein
MIPTMGHMGRGLLAVEWTSDGQLVESFSTLRQTEAHSYAAAP